MSIDWQALAAPFPPAAIEWRVGQRSKAGDKATVLAYLTSRAVMDRLDEVVGPARWRDSYTPLTDTAGKVHGFMCTLELEVEAGVWVGRTDVSDTTDIEALKGGVSGALKRAAVKWGIGRYLYGLDSRYLPIVEGYPPRGSHGIYCPMGAGRTPGHIIPPALPAWALPAAPQASPQAPPAATADDRIGRMWSAVVDLEQTLGPQRVAEVRRACGIKDPDKLPEKQLIEYGRALRAAQEGP